MIPLKAARKLNNPPVVTPLIILINVVVFLWQTTLGNTELYRLYMTAGFVPCQVTQNLLSPASLSTFITSMFLHGGWLHLIGNMMFLWAFGPAVEDYLGRRLFAVFYILAGIGGGLMHLLFNLGVCIPAIGASGAIMGVLGGFALLYPGTRISTLILFRRIPVGVTQVPALYLLVGFFLVDLFAGVAALSADPIAATSGIAVWAHVGGFLVGFLMAFFMMSFKPLPPVDPDYS